MPLTNDPSVNQWILSAAVMAFLVWGVIAAAIGAGLMVSGDRMFRLFGLLDHHVSTRQGFKPLAMAHDVGQSVRKHRYLFGALFVAGAAYSIYGLAARFDGPAIVAALNLPYPRGFVLWILESVRWCLITFGAWALAIGVMLGFFPAALGRLEARGNRWISVRRLAGGVDAAHLPLDRLVRAFPRTAGSAILAGALFVVTSAAIAWGGIR